MSETFDIEILRHALVKAVERYDAGVYEGSLEVYAPELLEAFTRLEQAEQAVQRVRDFCSVPCTPGCCSDCEAKNEVYEQVLSLLDGEPNE